MESPARSPNSTPISALPSTGGSPPASTPGSVPGGTWFFAPALALAALKLLLHLLYCDGYGYYRDELYFLACADRLDFGYVDHAPLLPALTALLKATLGTSLLALRFLPALSGALLVLMADALARQMGGRWPARCLASLAVFAAPLFWRSHSMLTPAAFEGLLWAVACGLVLHLLRSGRGSHQRWSWLTLGAILGLGTLNKYSFLLFGGSLGAGLLLAPASAKALAFSRNWRAALWGLALGGILILPTLLWQVRHGWPTVEFLTNLATDVLSEISILEFCAGQLFFLNPLAAPIWLAGLVWIFTARHGKPFAAFGWSFLLLFLFLLLAKGKIYYLGPAYPVLLAAGAVALERWVAGGIASGIASGIARRTAGRTAKETADGATDEANRPDTQTPRSSLWARSQLPFLAVGLVAWAVWTAPLVLPVLPLEKLSGQANRATFGLRGAEVMAGHFYDMVGWRRLARETAEVWAQLPPAERVRCRILAGNYGEASALNFFGTSAELPFTWCGHNSYYLWGLADARRADPDPPDRTAGEPTGGLDLPTGGYLNPDPVWLTLGMSPSRLERVFGQVEELAMIPNPRGVFYERNLRIHRCRKLKTSWSQAWPLFKHYH